MSRKKHADLIHAWAEGAEIQVMDDLDGKWKDVSEPMFKDKKNYRQKLQIKYRLFQTDPNEGPIIVKAVINGIKGCPHDFHEWLGPWVSVDV